MHSHIDQWALSLVTDPARAATARRITLQRAWCCLKAQRGQTCRYPWLPAPRRTGTEAAA
ncbi:hypothetical protein [Paenirhodobacter enshiensis]|uniref:hypothetical protein n=1 Tax=Paenirhodobacter enshiensis TaxID=1105367 RepID=UPI0012690E4A|nr:hypothetical protein [Paenirhodobacter enshiensis]